MLIYKTGDLLNFPATYICQQVNCMGVMGAGLAKQIALRWPIVKERYREYCKNIPLERRLGKCQIIPVGDMIDMQKTQYVVNLFGQYDFGREDKLYTRYSALYAALRTLRKRIRPNETVAFPYGIGCGLANGDWNTVGAAIDSAFSDMDVYIVRR